MRSLHQLVPLGASRIDEQKRHADSLMAHHARLLFIIADGWPTHRADVAVLFGKELPRHGISCDLVAQSAEPGEKEPRAWMAGETFIYRRTGRRTRDQMLGFLHDCRVLWSAHAAGYDGLQVRDKVFAGLVGLLRARHLRKPFFFWMSYPMSESSIEFARREGLALGVMRWAFVAFKGYVGRFLIYKVLLPRCNHVFVQSDRMLIDVATHGIPQQRMTAVPMGVDLEGITHDRSEEFAAPSELLGKRVIGYLGILDRGRRIDFLFEVLSVVRRSVPNACLLLVGDATEASDRRWLEARARELNVDDAIIWTGWVQMEVGWAYLRGVDVAVSLFPRGELLDSASPTKVVEYLALGLPVVANDQPDQDRVLTESGAGFSVGMVADEFAAAIVRILQDEQLGANMRAAGPPYINRRRSYALIGQQVAEVYRKQFSRASGSAPDGAGGRVVPRDSA